MVSGFCWETISGAMCSAVGGLRTSAALLSTTSGCIGESSITVSSGSAVAGGAGSLGAAATTAGCFSAGVEIGFLLETEDEEEIDRALFLGDVEAF